MWDAHSGKLRRRLPVSGTCVWDVSWTADCRPDTLVTVSDDRLLNIVGTHRIPAPAFKNVPKVHEEGAEIIARSSDGRYYHATALEMQGNPDDTVSGESWKVRFAGWFGQDAINTVSSWLMFPDYGDLCERGVCSKGHYWQDVRAFLRRHSYSRPPPPPRASQAKKFKPSEPRPSAYPLRSRTSET